MYNQIQFLHMLNEYYNAKIDKQNIDNLTQFLTTKSIKQKKLIFDCNKCGKRHIYDEEELEMDFELVATYERNMGHENEYQSIEYLDCDECGNIINVMLRVWEYPVGAHNYNDIDIDGATIIEQFNFTLDFHGKPEHDICKKCGTEFIDKKHKGVCDNCNEEYNTK